MLSIDQIQDSAKSYENIGQELLLAMENESLHEHLSLRLMALEELKASRKEISSAINSLRKKVNADLLNINQEIRRRAHEKGGGEIMQI